MDDCAVINASPLIFLARGGHLSLLDLFARHLVVPRPVADEIVRRGAGDPASRALACSGRFEIVVAAATPPQISAWGLGAGESAVLAYALSVKGAIVILDDLAARRCAAALGLPVRGTLGLVLAAKRSGHIALARPVIEDLIRGGMYLSRQVLDEALSRVGE